MQTTYQSHIHNSPTNLSKGQFNDYMLVFFTVAAPVTHLANTGIFIQFSRTILTFYQCRYITSIFYQIMEVIE